ncbi:site-specific integrase [Sphingomonas faeni]|uniref:site-specific integrase n=1 Tax=Sphingomonas faeni TaxID=185950 RepID=UPI0020C1896C|nr:site-specific integrase [Sphingomonas faeni]MCK8457895.1 tyrosine-type recombinase/integrase [Sphingomonas faeni]
MPKAHLTHAFALNAQCEAGRSRSDWYDESVTGFVLECRSTGGKTYYLRYPDAAGRQKQHKIGRYEDISFATAKKAAQRLRSEVVMGVNPAAKKAEAKAIPLYAELAAMHLADAELHQRSFSTTRGYMKHILKRWGRTRVSDIDARAVAQWLATKRDEGLAPATVIKIKAIFGRSYELGMRWGIAGCDRNPVRGIQSKPLNNARERFLSTEEAGRLITAADRSRNPLLSPVVGLLLLTGMRVSELLAMRWEHVDLIGRSMYVPTSKTGRSRYVPLAQAAVTIIEQMQRIEGAVFLFPSPKVPAKHLTTIKHGWQTARDAAGLPGLRIHDLRHSAASFMVNSGVDLFAVGKVLGHANVASTARYSHLANDTLLAAVEAGAAKQAQPA